MNDIQRTTSRTENSVVSRVPVKKSRVSSPRRAVIVGLLCALVGCQRSVVINVNVAAVSDASAITLLADTAARETASNAQQDDSLADLEMCGSVDDEPSDETDSPDRAFLAGPNDTFWTAGQTLDVVFLDGSAEAQQAVANVAHTWSKYANIHFAFHAERPAGGADLTVTFKGRGYHSVIGRRSKNTAAKGLPSITLSGMDHKLKNTVELRRVVLHEFGHALGLVHEHQNPTANIQWNRPLVTRYFNRTQGWTPAMVERNLFRHQDASRYFSSEFDAKSIMLYAIPSALTLDGFHTGWNTDLSPMDKKFIALLYPSSGVRSDLTPSVSTHPVGSPPTMRPPAILPPPLRPPPLRPPPARPPMVVVPPHVPAATVDWARLSVSNSSRPMGDRAGKPWFEWTARLTGPRSVLSHVASVTWYLHPSFTNPVRPGDSTKAGFPITSSGWGTFTLRVLIRSTEGEVVQRLHRLAF